MPAKRIPSYRLHKSTGQAVVTLSGRDHYLGKYDTDESREAYARAIASWEAGGRLALPPKVAPVSVAAMVARFWRHLDADGLYLKNGRPTSERTCMRVALRPLLALYGSTPAAEFSPRCLRLVRDELCKPAPARSTGRKVRVHKGPRARQSVNKHVHRIRGVFRWAVEEELVPADTWHRLRAVKALGKNAPGTVEGGGVRTVDLRDVVRVLRAVDDRTAAMIRLQYYTGARPGEICAMRMGDLDRRGPVWIYRPGSHKTEHHGIAREIMIGPKAQAILSPFVQLDPSAPLFPGRRGPLPEVQYAKLIRNARRSLGIRRWTPHQLRHNALTNARRLGGIETAQTVGGHRNISTTEIYAEQDRQRAIEYAQAHG